MLSRIRVWLKIHGEWSPIIYVTRRVALRRKKKEKYVG